MAPDDALPLSGSAAICALAQLVNVPVDANTGLAGLGAHTRGLWSQQARVQASSRPWAQPRCSAPKMGTAWVEMTKTAGRWLFIEFRDQTLRSLQASTSKKRWSLSDPNKGCLDNFAVVVAGLVKPHKKRACCLASCKALGCLSRKGEKTASSMRRSKLGVGRGGGKVVGTWWRQ